MKNKILLLLCCFSLVACAQRMDDDAGDDDGHHQPDPDPDPTPDPACDSADDCLDDLGCNVGVCNAGTCSYESTCSNGQVCNVQTDRCEAPTQPTTHGISCFHTGDTLYLTIAGQLTDSVYGGALANPKFISVASDQIANSWNVNASTTAPKVVLSDAERTSGYVASASINLPSNQAQRFTLMVWSDDGGGYARRLDLGDWTVSGDGCARIDDGAPEGSTDGYIIGRAPLCANACDDGNASTTDVCSASGCIHEGGTTTPGYGTLSCSESGSNTIVTVTGPIVANVFNNAGLVPNSSASVRFGYGGTDSKSWVSDTATYALTMPNTVAGFNLKLLDQNGVEHWFDVNRFNMSGTCSRGTGEFRHTVGSGTSSDGYGHIACSVNGPDMTVTINGILNHTLSGTINPTSAWRIQYGSPQDGWTVPYAAGVSKPQLSWVNNTVTYVMTMSSSINGFNLALTDGVNAYWFDLNEYTTSGCTISGGALHH